MGWHVNCLVIGMATVRQWIKDRISELIELARLIASRF